MVCLKNIGFIKWYQQHGSLIILRLSHFSQVRSKEKWKFSKLSPPDIVLVSRRMIIIASAFIFSEEKKHQLHRFIGTFLMAVSEWGALYRGAKPDRVVGWM